LKHGQNELPRHEETMTIDELETPALVVDLDTMEKNLARMGAYVQQHGLKLRPHAKTHKSSEIARMQIASGAWGVTVAKSTEAEVMAKGGIDHLLLAYPVYGPQKLERLTAIARQGAHLTIAIDDARTLEPLAAAAATANVQFDILTELNVGMNRCGLAAPEDVLALAQKIDSMPGVRFAGLNLYPGHIWAKGEEQLAMLRSVDAHATAVIALLKEHGLDCTVVSGGSTPTAFQSHHVKSLTEIRPGTYVFNDRNTMDTGACALEDCALRVLVTVVSTAVDGWIVVDSGTKTLSSDRLHSGNQQFHGLVIEDPGMQIERLSEEHGQINLVNARARPHIGDRLSIVPNHVCATVNMHDRIWYHRKGEVLGSWSIAARGCVR
jgi:D-serine deaminase-like pyridoxal phosphate-dependent protein